MSINQVSTKKGKNASDDLKITKSFKFDGIERQFDTGSQGLDSKQTGQAILTIARDGGHFDISLKGSFSNGKKWDGDTFVAMAWLIDGDGQKVKTIRVQKGVDARIFRSKPVKGSKTKTEDISQAQLSRVKTIVLSLGYKDIVDDQGNWIKVITAAIEAFGEANESSDTGP